jgi:hypothetical protein
MNVTTTAGLAAVALILAVIFGWLGARPAKPLAAPRLAPWRAMMLVAFTAMVAFLVHLVALLRGG